MGEKDLEKLSIKMGFKGIESSADEKKKRQPAAETGAGMGTKPGSKAWALKKLSFKKPINRYYMGPNFEKA